MKDPRYKPFSGFPCGGIDFDGWDLGDHVASGPYVGDDEENKIKCSPLKNKFNLTS